MRIVHISDLHFGNHHPLLANNLKDRLRTLKPDVILCSGDVADTTSTDLTDEARVYLDGLADHCVAAEGPRIILVPGNHDMRKAGWLLRPFNNAYAKVFGASETHHYYERENVWIFGFDSAEAGKFGGSGVIKDDDIDRFHHACEALSTNDKFARAFKIVVVHHHPLPVHWNQDEKDRWLTMTNAGRFLSAILYRRIDLVLHGHEHLQARARLWSTLGANNHQTTVVGLGATLLRLNNRERNWFGVVEVDEATGASINFYGSVGDVFNATPEGETFWIRSMQASADDAFEDRKRASGLVYRAVASVTLINRDGDSRRSIECDDLTLLAEPPEGAVRVAVPHTSGYLDRLKVTGKNDPRLVETLPEGERKHEFTTALIFDQRPPLNTPFDYTIRWHTVNSFAMDRRQFDHLYPGRNQRLDNIEFTHFDVHDPIEQLTVIARFPEGFVPERPRLRVSRIDAGAGSSRDWENVPHIEDSLTREYALRYFESIHIAALRVRRPQVGFSYGIQWTLPEAPQVPLDHASNQIRAVINKLKTTPPTSQQCLQVAAALEQVVQASRALLNPLKEQWNGTMEASLMVFHSDQHQLRVLAAVESAKGKARLLDFSNVTLAFGDGIAGRAFKTNQPRLFIKEQDEQDESAEPALYIHLPGVPVHEVLVSVPVQAQSPQVRPPYGVLNVGSIRADCPLRLIAPESSHWQSKISAFKGQAESLLHAALGRIFLDDPDDQGALTPPPPEA